MTSEHSDLLKVLERKVLEKREAMDKLSPTSVIVCKENPHDLQCAKLAEENKPSNNRDVPTYNIFVGDLAPDVSADDLRNAFHTCGPMHSCDVIRDRETGLSKRFGFVNFLSEEGQQNALGPKYTDMVIKGHRVRVNVSDSKATLYIGNLPRQMDSNEIRAALERLAGPIVNLKLKEGYGFVTYVNARRCTDASQRLTGQQVEGHPLIVQFPKDPKTKGLPKTDPFAAGKFTTPLSLYVNNLAATVTDSVLRSHFSKYGNVIRAVVVKNPEGKSRGFGFVEFDSATNCETAVSVCDSTQLHGQCIHVAFARTKAPSDSPEWNGASEAVLQQQQPQQPPITTFNLDGTVATATATASASATSSSLPATPKNANANVSSASISASSAMGFMMESTAAAAMHHQQQQQQQQAHAHAMAHFSQQQQQQPQVIYVTPNRMMLEGVSGAAPTVSMSAPSTPTTFGAHTVHMMSAATAPTTASSVATTPLPATPVLAPMTVATAPAALTAQQQHQQHQQQLLFQQQQPHHVPAQPQPQQQTQQPATAPSFLSRAIADSMVSYQTATSSTGQTLRTAPRIRIPPVPANVLSSMSMSSPNITPTSSTSSLSSIMSSPAGSPPKVSTSGYLGGGGQRRSVMSISSSPGSVVSEVAFPVMNMATGMPMHSSSAGTHVTMTPQQPSVLMMQPPQHQPYHHHHHSSTSSVASTSLLPVDTPAFGRSLTPDEAAAAASAAGGASQEAVELESVQSADVYAAASSGGAPAYYTFPAITSVDSDSEEAMALFLAQQHIQQQQQQQQSAQQQQQQLFVQQQQQQQQQQQLQVAAAAAAAGAYINVDAYGRPIQAIQLSSQQFATPMSPYGFSPTSSLVQLPNGQWALSSPAPTATTPTSAAAAAALMNAAAAGMTMGGMNMTSMTSMTSMAGQQQATSSAPMVLPVAVPVMMPTPSFATGAPMVSLRKPSVYIGNLPLNMTASQLQPIFESMIGRFQQLHLKKGYCFLSFNDYGEASAAALQLNNRIVEGRRLNAQIARERLAFVYPRAYARMPSDGYIHFPTSASFQAAQAEDRTLYVGNIPAHVTEAALSDHFSMYGEVVRAIVSVDMSTGLSRGYGFIEYKSKDSCQKAVDALNGSEFEGSSIVVKFSDKVAADSAQFESQQQQHHHQQQDVSDQEEEEVDEEAVTSADAVELDPPVTVAVAVAVPLSGKSKAAAAPAPTHTASAPASFAAVAAKGAQVAH